MGYTLEQIIHGTIGIVSSKFDKFNVAEDEAIKRLDICKDCPSLIVKRNRLTNSDTFKCGMCGCLLSAKTKLKSEKCPKGHW